MLKGGNRGIYEFGFLFGVIRCHGKSILSDNIAHNHLFAVVANASIWEMPTFLFDCRNRKFPEYGGCLAMGS